MLASSGCQLMSVGAVRLCQRMYVDVDGAARGSAPPAHAMTANVGLMRLLACFVAAVVYVCQEQIEFSFPQIQFAVFILEVCVLSPSLCMFQRGPSGIQPLEAHGRRAALHRPSHPGNLRHPARRLRSLVSWYPISPLTRDSRTKQTWPN